MSDHFEYWFFPELELSEVAEAKSRILGAFWSRSLVETTNDPELILGGKEAYGPTAELATLYSKPERLGGVSLTLMTRGMEVCEGFGFKGWELNEIEDVICPDCEEVQKIDTLPIYDAIDDFHTTGVIPNIICPLCKTSRNVRKWESNPRLTFTYLGFAFWNWPPLKGVLADDYNSAGEWVVDIPKLMSETINSPIYYSYGRI